MTGRRAAVPLLLAAAGATAAGFDDPACRAALDTLARAESRATPPVLLQPGATSASGPAPALPAARRAALQACLGAADAASVPRRSAPALAAETPASATPRPAAATEPARRPEAAPAPRAPVTLTQCDATGCWTSAGTRLQRLGPNTLSGPGGVCTVTAGVVSCP